MNVKSSEQIGIKQNTAEFLIFTNQAGEGIEVRYEDESIWLTQKLMAEVFGVERSVVTKHLKNIFEDGELEQDSVCANFAHTASDGKTYRSKYYSLDAIISVGYRVNSKKATQFRQWATKVLKQFAIQGYVIDKERLKNGEVFGKDYFEQLLSEIREIPMSMSDWSKRLDKFLDFDDRNILQDAGEVSAQLAKAHAESEFEKYRIVQDQTYTSDFDKAVAQIEAAILQTKDEVIEEQ